MRKKQLNEKPLNYWEEKSYMMIIPEDQEADLLKNAIDGVSHLKGVKLIEHDYEPLENSIKLKIVYEKETYEIGVFVGGINVPEYYINDIQFTKKEVSCILNAKKALTIYMKFDDDVKKCFHLQLKLSRAMVPDLVGLLDESAERMFSRKWVLLTSQSKIRPSSKDLFSVQAVYDKKKKLWLHTHGLTRCGLTEIEILDSDVDNQRNHYNLINTYAMYLIDKKDKDDPCYKGAYIGNLINGYPIVVTCIPWTEGILEYKKLKQGGLKDRKNGHNTKTSIIFLYRSSEDEKNHITSKISDYDKLWGENPLFFYSDEETDRMKALARERFDYVRKGHRKKENAVLIKIGLPLPEKGKYEHIWFELLGFKDDKFKARLTQEPYYFKDIHEGYEAWYTKEDVTDWIVYTPLFSVNPDNAYLLDRDEE